MTQNTRLTLLVATILIVVIGILKHLADYSANTRDFAFVAVVLFQVFVPGWLVKKQELVDWHNWRADLKRVALLVLVFFPLFWLGYHSLQSFFASQNEMTAHFSFAVPSDFFLFVLTSAIIVSVSEEIFYRGYVQTQLLKAWPVAPAIIVTNLFFALGHFIGDYHFGRLLTFFPGLLFSYLVFRSRSLFGAVLFHGLCNIFAELLRESYYWK